MGAVTYHAWVTVVRRVAQRAVYTLARRGTVLALVATLLASPLLSTAQIAQDASPGLRDTASRFPDLARITSRGTLLCGIDQTEAEYTMDEAHGARVAFDSALCRAMAVALLGPAAQVKVAAYPDETTALGALRRGEVDVVATISADLTRTSDPSVTLTAPVLHDPVTLLAAVAAKIEAPRDLAGRKICFLAETDTEASLQDWARAQGVVYVPFPFQEQGEMEAAFATNNCAALAGDATRLGDLRASLGAHAALYRMVPFRIGGDPLAIAVRQRDAALAHVAQWTVQALLLAEQAGITAANVRALAVGKSATVDRLLGRTREIGRPLGLREEWAREVVEAVGNYAEMFDRTLGLPMGLMRGENALCEHGGALCPLPIK